MAAITTGSWAKAMWPGVREFFGMKYNEYKPEWPDIFDKETSTKAFEEFVSTSGFGLAVVKNEGAPVTYDTAEQGFVFRFTHVTYGLGFIVTEEMHDDNLHMEVGLRRAESLAFSLRQTKEIVCANILNRAFNASYTYGDGKELCSTLNPNKAGGTYANELTTPAELSDTALEQACIDISGFTNDRGLAIRVLPQKLIIPAELEFDAARTLKSIQQPGTANNDINAIRVLGKIPQGYAVNHYLTDPKFWFLKTDVKGLKLLQRKPMSFKMDNDFDTTNAKFRGLERYSAGVSDKRSIFGSPGD